jgi:hypothetical protein
MQGVVSVRARIAKPLLVQWLLSIVLLCGHTHAQELSQAQPVFSGELSAGSTMQVKLHLTSGKRTYLTLIPIDGDADLFVLLSPDETVENAKFKSTSPALETERIMLPAQQRDCDAIAVVRAETQTRFVLFATWVSSQLTLTPQKRVVIAVDAYEILGSGDALLVAITLRNATPAWYEFTLKCEGDLLKKANLPNRFILGPKGEQYIGWVVLSPTSKLVVSAERTKRSDAFLIADIVSRAIVGTALSPNLAIVLDDLLEDLEPLMPVADALRRGDWKKAGSILISVIRKNPKTLTALHSLLTRSGIRIPKDLLNTKIGLGLGSVSAVITAIGAMKAPQKEEVIISAQ